MKNNLIYEPKEKRQVDDFNDIEFELLVNLKGRWSNFMDGWKFILRPRNIK